MLGAASAVYRTPYRSPGHPAMAPERARCGLLPHTREADPATDPAFRGPMLGSKWRKCFRGISGVGISMMFYIIEGSLEVKLPTIWRDEKQSRAEAERRGRLEERRSEERVRRQKIQMREKVGKSRNTVFFQ